MAFRCGAVIVACALLACGGETDDPESDGGRTDAATADGATAGDAAATAGDAAARDATTPDAAPPMREVAIRFGAAIGDEPFACGETYEDVGSTGATVTPRELRLYVQDLRLITADGAEVPVQLDDRSPWQSRSAGVALLDFASTDGDCANYATA